MNCKGNPPSSPPRNPIAETRPSGIGSWAQVIEADVDPSVVTDSALRDAIRATGLPWRVVDKGTNIEMLLIPSGELVMGKSKGDSEANRDELPAHDVKLTKAFYLGRYEVTQEQYAAIAKAIPSWFAKFKASSVEALMKDGDTKVEAEKKVSSVAPPPAPNAKGREWPVEQVSWADCKAFCKKAGFRLPTEAEWEYACRAGTRTPSFWAVDAIAWSSNNSNKRTHAVGTKLANALGLHDMIGNVSEWVNDWYGSTYYSTSPSVNPPGPSSGTHRVSRGGNWYCNSYDCRASNRSYVNPDFSSSLVGFRVARTP